MHLYGIEKSLNIFHMMVLKNQIRKNYSDIKFKKDYYKVTKMMDGIIPIAYSYKIGYLNDDKLCKLIPMPINMDKIKYDENEVDDKIVIFHGLIRELFKGTEIIVYKLNE